MIRRKTYKVFLLCNKSLEDDKIFQVAGSKIGSSFSVLGKSRFFTGPASLLFSGYRGPFPEIKMEFVKMTTCLYLVPKLGMGGSVPPLFRTPSCCVQAKLYLFTCLPNRKKSFVVNFCLPRTYSNVLQVCHMFLRIGLSSGAGCRPCCCVERIAVLHIPLSCLQKQSALGST
jgi:hypothetical protein